MNPNKSYFDICLEKVLNIDIVFKLRENWDDDMIFNEQGLALLSLVISEILGHTALRDCS